MHVVVVHAEQSSVRDKLKLTKAGKLLGLTCTVPGLSGGHKRLLGLGFQLKTIKVTQQKLAN